ncbi:hypothetical protein Tco_1113441 [Tanacetum coccineum]|uniref:Retrovirus-related Pol polyprotein from transposon TNT 1-94 n=1 Tax=Tanacetum coccineum TaxID=301880 RepID=A0ABQ5IUX6_9ASTR
MLLCTLSSTANTKAPQGDFQTRDHADALDTQKSTSRDYSFLGDKLVVYVKKQNYTAMSFQQRASTWRICKLTEYQLADMFTKALPEDRFKYLVRRIGMRCLTPADLEVLTNETA